MDIGVAVIVAFFVLFVFGFPVVFAILVPSIAYIAWAGIPLATIAQRVLYSMDSFPLVAVPIFIFVGNLMNSAGITEKLFRFADVLVGRLYGGLAQVNIVASLIFAGVSGAALADVGGLGRIEIKAMKDRGFSLPFSAAITGASAIVGPIFPPSIPLIIYASITSISALQLLVAGIIPALICVAMLMIATAIVAMRTELPRAEHWPTFCTLWNALWPAAPALFAPVVLVGGMLSGSFTPTEASAVCVVYVLLVGAFYYRDMKWGFIRDAAIATVRGTAAILIIVAAASMFGWILAVEQVPQQFAAWFHDISSNPLILLMVVNVIFFIAGMFVEFDHSHSAAGPDRRSAGGGRRRRPDPPRHHRRLQSDDRNDHAAVRPIVVSIVQHDRSSDGPPAQSHAAVLPAAACHACHPYAISSPGSFHSADAAIATRCTPWLRIPTN